MGIVRADHHDAFFSYAWDDNDYYDGWVRDFYDEVAEKLAAALRTRRSDVPVLQSIGDLTPSLFIDQQGLPVNGMLSSELEAAVGASEFLFVFIGGKYPSSQWGGLEVDAFVKAQQAFGRSERDIKERIFVVLLEGSIMQKSWGRPYLDQFRHDSLFQIFSGTDGSPIPPRLGDEDRVLRSNPQFTSKIRRLVDTLVDRMIQAMSAPTSATSSGTRPAAPTERLLSGVTIGVVKENLAPAAARLAEALGRRGIRTQVLAYAEITGDDDAPVTVKLAESKVFVQPFDYSKVLMARSPGGHLKYQEAMLPKELETIWWLVPPAIGGLGKGDSEAECRDIHVELIDAWAARAKTAGIDELAQFVGNLVDVGGPAATEMPTVYIESGTDQHITKLLGAKLTELWQAEFGDTPLLPFPVPWHDLDGHGELLRDCHGVIFVYAGEKTPVSLKDQIKKLEGKLFEIRTDPGKAIALAPPRTGPIGWPLNFNCRIEDDKLTIGDEDRAILKDFLHAVQKSSLHATARRQ